MVSNRPHPLSYSFNMFWKVNFRQPSAIDGLLDKEVKTICQYMYWNESKPVLYKLHK